MNQPNNDPFHFISIDYKSPLFASVSTLTGTTPLSSLWERQWICWCAEVDQDQFSLHTVFDEKCGRNLFFSSLRLEGSTRRNKTLEKKKLALSFFNWPLSNIFICTSIHNKSRTFIILHNICFLAFSRRPFWKLLCWFALEETYLFP